ncbi:substrate-binding periplasmic protein [Cognaticolwellia mytili]|uniref:substrate-binding periplasmic protein n=1 Tax=Cognaticolwellia mytili TaxID=1888913 RepID=UPI000A16F068|nr:transporter substrate-binding domain-containing protein [Cognaticolwellia mytili]
MCYKRIPFKQLLKFTLLFCFLLTTTAYACEESKGKAILENYIWLTEDYPPYNFYDEQGRLTGMSVDILEMVYEELQITFTRDDIQLIPWARLVRDLKLSQKFAAFTMVYTKERAEHYTLVATPLPTTISIMVLEERLEELRKRPIKELSIAVVREDIGQLALQNINSKQVATTSHQSMVNMLYHGRVDAISFNEELVKYQYNDASSDKHNIRTLLTLKDSLDNNFTFHKETPVCVIELFTSALAKLSKKGQLQHIRKKYLPED